MYFMIFTVIFNLISAICVECFRAGDHTGHDYSVTHVGGGCCDCGDPQAWKPKGFCRNHRVCRKKHQNA